MALPEEERGPVARGDIPEPLRATYMKPGNTAPVDLTGYEVECHHIIPAQGETLAQHVTLDTAVVADAQAGRVRYDFRENDLEVVGTHKFYFVVWSGAAPVTSRLSSKVLLVNVVSTPADVVAS